MSRILRLANLQKQARGLLLSKRLEKQDIPIKIYLAPIRSNRITKRELDLRNYATKKEIRAHINIDPSRLAKAIDLTSTKTELDSSKAPEA